MTSVCSRFANICVDRRVRPEKSNNSRQYKSFSFFSELQKEGCTNGREPKFELIETKLVELLLFEYSRRPTPTTCTPEFLKCSGDPMAGQPMRSADNCHHHYLLRGSQSSAQLYQQTVRPTTTCQHTALYLQKEQVLQPGVEKLQNKKGSRKASSVNGFFARSC